MEIRSKYSNRAVTYSNTAVRKCRYTLIKQSALEHNLDFESIILSIIGWIFEQEGLIVVLSKCAKKINIEKNVEIF